MRGRPYALLLLIALGSACGPAAANRPLPAYAGKITTLFDDTIEPSAVGMDLDKSYDPATDPQFRERTRDADAVLRVRILTVTARTSEAHSVYQLSMSAVGDEMVGKYPPKSPFNVRIDEKSVSIGLVKNLESGLVGKTFVIFVKEFVLADGDKELHFHLAPDSKAVIHAVSDSLALDEVKK
ncbi:MAG: hypothetical protein HOO96_38965 [Polyangiaceae bacterium]|nr:hypothetical protein [Polyangiaceae bacterium]